MVGPSAVKRFAPSTLAAGVEELQGEANVYLVQSKSRAGTLHRVDLEDFAGFASCTCEHFQMSLASKIENAILNGRAPDKKWKCEHVRRAQDFYYAKAIQMDIFAKEAEGRRRCAR